MESSLGGINYEYDLQGLSEGVRNLDCACLLWIGEHYIHKTNHDVLCV